MGRVGASMATAERHPDAIRLHRASSRSWSLERVPAEPGPGPTRLAAPRTPASGFRPGRVTVPRASAKRTPGLPAASDFTALDNLLPRGPAWRGRQHPSAADRDRPIKADVPLPSFKPPARTRRVLIEAAGRNPD